jgi:protein N-terminal methyltransferase
VQEINSEELWKSVKAADGGDDSWYQVAVDYWDRQEPSYNGVLGGYGFVSDVDLRDSQILLLKVCSLV